MSRSRQLGLSLLLMLLLAAVALDAQRRGRRQRTPPPNPVLEAVTGIRCSFSAAAQGVWTEGHAKAEVSRSEAPVEVTFTDVDVQGSTAELTGLGAPSEVTVRVVGSNLHFLDIRPTGSLAVTTVFGNTSTEGRLKAVLSRSEFGEASQRGGSGTPAASQLYGDCEIVK